MKYDGIIFDLDGTLWDASAELTASWNAVLQKQPDVPGTLTLEDLQGVLGLGAEDLTAKLFPYLSKERRMQIFNDCAAYECDYLSVHGATLYPKLIETLETLQQEHTLYVVSNCNDGYIQSFLKAHNAGRLFRDFECIGRTGLPKSENIKRIVARNHLQNPVYVGDTQWDFDAATAAGVPFIFAAYGFGCVSGTPAIQSPSELPALV